MLDKVTAAAVRTAKRWIVPLPGILEMGVDHMVEVGEDLVSEQGLDSHKQNHLGKIDKTVGRNTIAAVAVQVVGEDQVSEQGLDSHKQNLLGKIDKSIGDNTIAAVAVQVADIHHVSWVQGYKTARFHHIQLSPDYPLPSSPYLGSGEGPKGSSQQRPEGNWNPPPFLSSPQPKWALGAMHHHGPWRLDCVKRRTGLSEGEGSLALLVVGLVAEPHKSYLKAAEVAFGHMESNNLHTSVLDSCFHPKGSSNSIPYNTGRHNKHN